MLICQFKSCTDLYNLRVEPSDNGLMLFKVYRVDCCYPKGEVHYETHSNLRDAIDAMRGFEMRADRINMESAN